MYEILAESVVSDSNNGQTVIATEKVVKDYTEKLLKIPNFLQQKQEKGFLIRSESDKFDYKILRLANDIRIVLISDPTYKQLSQSASEDIDESNDENEGDDDEEKMSTMSDESIMNGNVKNAAIVIGVKVGSIQDPKEIQGMAHMLEHLLTMGSEKYPAENAIDEFLSSHGGYQNAHTEIEHTIYEIKVHPKHVSQVIDLIGNAFIKPLLRQESIEKEIKPIDTEFVQAKDDDDLRVDVLLSHLADTDHPVNKFMWGNKKSLIDDPKANNIDVHKMLLNFYRTFYQPENIVVVVQAQESLENLQLWTTSVFSNVVKPMMPDNLMTIEKFQGKLPFKFGLESRFNRLYRVESIDDGTRLLINWCLQPVIDQYLISPNDYWASLIGYEGKGSLISLLRERNLAMEIFTDSEIFCQSNNNFFIIFNIDLHLTDMGASNLDTIVQLLFEFLTVLQRSGAQEYYYNEKQAIALYSFNKKSEKDSLSNSIELAKNLLYLPLEHVLTGTSLFYHYDDEIINNFGSQLTIDKANFIVLNKKLEENFETQVEPWMNIKYQSSEIPEKWKSNAKNCSGKSNYFYYPKPNRFLAKNFDLLADTLPQDCAERKQGDYPMKIIDEKRMTVWHKCDFNYRLPNASFNIHILSPFNENCLENVAFNVVLQEYLTIILQEDTYDAYEAHMKWELARTCYGLTLGAKGFNEKLAELVLIVMERFLSVDFSENLLNSIKNDIIKEYRNKNRESQTFNQEIFSSILMERHFSYLNLIQKIQTVTIENLRDYNEKFLSNISFEILVQGNISIKETIELAKRLESMFLNNNKQIDPPLERIKQRVIQIPSGNNRIRLLTLADSSCMSYLELYQQLGPFDIRSKCYQSLFVEMINEQCFHVLRTCEGLGYMVGCCSQNMFGILGFSVYVASDADKFDCSFLDKRIREFLENYCKKFIHETLNEEKFHEYVTAAITEKLAPYLNLDDETTKHLTEIIIYDYCFDRAKKEAAQLQTAKLQDFRNWTDEFIFLPWNQRKMLSVEVVGNGCKAMNECLTLDCQPVCSEYICKNDESQVIRLLQSKCKDDQFIVNIDDFRKSLSFYPIQTSLKDLI
ncbi:Nrd1 complex RNA-binding subunit [Dermatophagoides farinae]|uniref:Nrd1 complex RNA-binding subunit n=1 Tax=Dermatophagoides farinae TaxID=6954 RepID=A0A922L5L2_DERFA|nr:Nrd1 complex RNA-binding subunit [Dermatophagoides farinae]